MTIGHNQPPASAAFLMHIEELFATADSITTIENDEQEAAVADLMQEIRKAKKDGDETRATEKRPHMEAAKAVDDEWREPLRKADIALDALKARLTPYRTAKLEAKNAAAQKAREEAEARQKAAQEALRSDDLEARYQGEIEIKAASKLATTANKIERQATGLRSYQVADVTDRRALLEHVMRTDPEALANWLADYARKALPAQLPGVTIRIERKAA